MKQPMDNRRKRNLIIAFIIGGLIGTLSLNGFNYFYLKQPFAVGTTLVDFVLFGALGAFLYFVNTKKRGL